MGMLGGGNSKFFFSSRISGEMIPNLTHIFQMGWFNHQVGIVYLPTFIYHKNQRYSYIGKTTTQSHSCREYFTYITFWVDFLCEM